jgi:hypothetical protein
MAAKRIKKEVSAAVFAEQQAEAASSVTYH